MKLKYGFYVDGILRSSSENFDDMIVHFSQYLDFKRSFLLDCDADASLVKCVVEIDKVFEDGDLF